MQPRFAMQPEPSLFQRLAERLDELLWRKDFEFCELLSGILMFFWGVSLLMPWSTFSTSASYAAMAAIAPEPAWGLVLGWIGFTEIGALILDQRRVRRWSAMGAALAWSFIAATFAIANPQGTGIVVYPALALASAWAYWRMRRASA